MTDRPRIGVRFCGGCNPRYDRVGALRMLRESLPQLIWESVEPGMEYDRYLLICGCMAACVTVKDLPGDKLVWVRSPEELKRIRETFQHL